jgi:hypothetical protein
LSGWCFYVSPAAEDWLLGCALLSLCSLDQTAPDLFAAGHPHRPWPKQVRAHRRKRALTKTSHSSEATSETASLHQDRPHPPRAFGKNGSDLEPSPLHCSTRDSAAVASGALSLVLEAQVQGCFSYAQGRCRNYRASSGRWRERIAVFGAERIRGELLKLGLQVCKRTIQKYMRGVRTKPPRGQKWSTFLRSHAANIWSCDALSGD